LGELIVRRLIVGGCAMDFKELIKRRYSVRAYKTDAVPAELLDQVLDAARLAPTAANRQPFRLLVVTTQGKEAELKRVYRADWFSQPPIVIGVCAVPGEAWSRSDGHNYAEVDAAIVMDHITLAAADLGLGTCWIGAFDPSAAREVFCLPDGVEPVAFTPLGYPADIAAGKKRKAIEDLVKYDKWKE